MISVSIIVITTFATVPFIDMGRVLSLKSSGLGATAIANDISRAAV